MKATIEQQEIIDTQDRSLLVRAGAGTGKTKTLVDRYMSLLENNPTWSVGNIVAITFTEKAAREMRQRVRQRIEQNAAEEPAFWATHRRALDQIRVSTIHGFCSQLLRENAIAAQIDPRFEVMEEAESTLLKEEAIRTTIERLAKEEHSALTLLHTLRAQELRDEMSTLLKKRGMVHQAFDQLPAADELMEKWRAGMDEMRSALWDSLRYNDPDLVEALSDLSGYEVEVESDKLVPHLRAAQAGIDHMANERWAEAIEAWMGIKINSGSQKNWGGADALKLLKGLLSGLRTAAAALEKQGCAATVGPADEAVALALQQWKALWIVLNQTYATLKTARQRLDFDDLELRTFELLSGSAKEEPRVQASLQNIKQLMVDEFQDTNDLQGKIVRLICPPEENRLFLIGDEKQSIYRFRQAQVTNFTKIEAELETLTGAKALPLSRSFRSQGVLVRGCNKLFESILRPEHGTTHFPFEAKPGNLEANRETRQFAASVEAAIEVIILPKKDAADESVSAADARIWEAKLLAERLLQLRNEAYLVEDGDGSERQFRFSDAAILFRSMSSLSLYEAQFKAAKIPYLVNSGKGYYDLPEIQDLMALLTALQNESNELSVAAMLRSPLFGLNDETLYRLRWRAGQNVATEGVDDLPRSLIDALLDPPIFTQDDDEQADAVYAAGETWRHLKAMVGRVEVWQLIDAATERTAYAGTLAVADRVSGGGRRINNLQKFTTIAYEHGGVSLADFLLRVENLRKAEVREGEAQGVEPEKGAVQIMTIHASKGLEYPVVIVADMGRKPNSLSQTNILCDPAFGLVCKLRDEDGDMQESAGYGWAKWKDAQMDLAERKRLLYVACTRARDLLILSGQEEKNSWMRWLEESWALPSETGVVTLDFGQLSVRRPVDQPDERRLAEGQKDAEADAGMKSIPLLALPLDLQMKPPSRAASRLARAANRHSDLLRPAVRRQDSDKAPQIPGYVLGNVVHMLLADWDCLTLEQGALNRYSGALLHRAGVVGEKGFAIGRINQMLSRLRADTLFAEIENAKVRKTEVSFTHRVDGQTIYGQIDMLYQRADGTWHIVDWKTEWVTPENVGELIERHRPQVQAYEAAVSEIVGAVPSASLCFLQPSLWVEVLN